MKKKITVTCILAIIVAAAAVCVYVFLHKNKPASGAVPPVRYVEGIIADSSSPEHRLVATFAPVDATKAIFLLGSSARCNSLAALFMACDGVDNVDGSRRPDGLKDFAGESICTLAGFPPSNDAIALREYTVRNVLAAMDTLCHVSPYDRSGMGRKPLPKMLVLASPYMTEFGKYDVDSLFSALGCRLPVISPVKLAVDAAAQCCNNPLQLTVGVFVADSGVDTHAYSSAVSEAGSGSSLCVPFEVPSDGRDALLAFLDYYSGMGYSRPIDALIVDDPSVDIAALERSLGKVKSVMNAESMTYGNLLSGGFHIIDAGNLAASQAYSWLRKYNLFTHRVSQPIQLDYMLIPKENGEDAFMLLQYNEKYIPSLN